MESKTTITTLMQGNTTQNKGHTGRIEKPLSIKVRLAMLGKKQIDLYDEINKIGGVYHVGSPAYFNNIVNERQTGGKAQMILTKCTQILNRWEMEENA